MLRLLLVVPLLGGCFTLGVSAIPPEYRLSPRKEAAAVIGAGLALGAAMLMSEPAKGCSTHDEPAEPGELDLPTPCLDIDGRYLFVGVGVVDVIFGLKQLVTNEYTFIK